MKKAIGTIKELRKTPRGRALLFFAFYFVFFIFLMIFSRVNISKKSVTGDYENGLPYNFNTSVVLNKNYKFNYKIILDDNTYTFQGEKYGDYELFKLDQKEYYRDGDVFYQKNDGWEKTDNPYIFVNFLNIEKVLDLLKYAMYESKTSYESGKNSYNFLLSTNTINKEWNYINSDFFENPNSFVLATDENNNLNHIVFYLDSYCRLNDLCKNSLTINIDYDEFGTISKINSPINDIIEKE